MSNANNSSECKRFEKEALMLIEKGETLDPHFDSCDTCIEERRKYQVLMQALSANTSSEPNADWQQNVLESIKQNDSSLDDNRNWSKQSWYKAIAACLAIVAIPGVFITQYAGRPAVEPDIEMALISGTTVYRSTSAKVGDELELKAQISEPETAALRVYRDNRVHFSCGVITPCLIVDDAINANISLSSLGEYQTVLFQPASTLSSTTTTLDQDVLFARDNDAEVVLSETLTVR